VIRKALHLHMVVKACTITVALLVAAIASADPPKEPQEAKKDRAEKGTEADADEEYRRESEKLVNGIELEIYSDDKWSKVKRIEKPLLFYGDPTRNNDRGSVWGWGEKGRPVALIEVYQNISNRTKWVYAICNTSGGKVRANRGGAPWWRENDSASELKDVPGAPAPSTEAPQRQRQIKQLAQKFTGHQFWDPNNTRYELRRLESPLYTYRDEDSGLLEGGLYTLANGTNPEIMIFLEARVDPNDRSKTMWQYTVGRLAHAELHMEYDGKEIFTAPHGDRVYGPAKPYWLGFITSAPVAKQDK
jgi:hypothetical protein